MTPPGWPGRRVDHPALRAVRAAPADRWTGPPWPRWPASSADPGTPSTPSRSRPPPSCCRRRPGPPGRGPGDRGRRAPLGPHPPRRRRRVRDRDRRPHRCRRRTGPARLLDLVAGRSAAAMSGLARRPRRRSATQVADRGDGRVRRLQERRHQRLPDAVTVMDPFHVVALAGAKLDLCRQRVQQDTLGHRGRTGDPLYRVRRTLRTRTRAAHRPPARPPGGVFAAEEHVAVEVTWWSTSRSSPPTPTQTHSAARRCSPA